MSKSVWDSFDKAPPAVSAQQNVWDTFPDATISQGKRLPQMKIGPDINVPFGTELKAAFSDNPADRLKSIGQAEGLPIEAAGRMGDREGFFDPTTQTYRPVEDSFAAKAKRFGAEMLARSPEFVLTGLAEMAGGATGNPALMVAAPALGAAAGEGIRQGVGNVLYDDPVSYLDIGTSATLGGVGGGINAVSRAYKLRNIAKDINKLDRPGLDGLKQSAKKWGIDLTPAEISGLPSLIREQKLLSRLDMSSDVLGGFYKKRNVQIGQALNDFLDTVAAAKGPLEGNLAGVQAAGKHIDDLKAARGAAAKPHYEAAYQSGADVDVSEIVGFLDSQIDKTVGQTKNSLNRAKKMFFNGKELRTDIEYLDNVKKELDDMASAASRAGNNNSARLLSKVKADLVDHMDAQVPEYNQARQAFADMSSEVVEAEEGIVGKIASLKDMQAKRAGKLLFSSESSDSLMVTRAKSAIQAANPEAWDDLIRAHFTEVIETKIKDTAKRSAGLGGRLHGALFGSDKQRRILKTALNEKQYNALDDLMNVLEVSARGSGGESITAFAVESVGAMKDMATGPLRKFIRNVFNPFGIPQKLDNALEERAFEKYASKLAETITDPQKQKELRQLRMMSRSEKIFVPAMASFLLQTLGGAGSAGLGMMTDAPLREGADYIQYISQNYGKH